MKVSRFLFAATFLALTFRCSSHIPSVRAFDIVVYSDARSGVNWVTQAHYCGAETRSAGRNRMLNNIGLSREADVYRWLDSMGTTCMAS
jgi:hypothetical protein